MSILIALFKIVGINLSSKSIKAILYGLALIFVVLASYGIYSGISNFFTQSKEDSATIGKLETTVDNLGKSNESLSNTIDKMGKIQEVSDEVKVDARKQSESSSAKTTSIIENKNDKIQKVKEQAKPDIKKPVTTEQQAEIQKVKEQAITAIVIDSMWQAYCKDNSDAVDCKG